MRQIKIILSHKFFWVQIYYEKIQKTIFYFTLAANQNDAEALAILGLIYLEGQNVSQDINKVIKYYTLAANGNNVDAQFNLGLLYIMMINIFLETSINQFIILNLLQIKMMFELK